MDYKANYELWKRKVKDETLKAELDKLALDEKALEFAFYKDLEFGTAGLRGEIGVGTNCLNVYTVAKVTQGIADCMKKYNQKVATVSYDSRINSQLFATTVAKVFAKNGITVYITCELMPTPYLSFITRYYKADIGVMITASHNPARYNGYKVYGADGCQLTDARANEMTEYIDKVDAFSALEGDVDQSLIRYVTDDVTQEYLNAVLRQRNGDASGIKVAYTPLNGTGYKLVPRILKEIGVTEIAVVDAQGMPDGNFTTCSYPNPEKKEALSLGLELAEKNKSDILIATDPDADRIGTAVYHNGEYKLISGNEMGVLLTDYLLKEKSENGTLPKNPVIVKTIVTTALVQEVAKQYDAEFYNVLTGFKYIGDVIAKLEAKGEQDRFVFGFEESYGYLSGTYVRDKDAVVASMLVAEMVAKYKRQNKTLIDRLNEIYDKFGTYLHVTKSKEYPGGDGALKMKELLNNLRNDLPSKIGDSKVIKTIDYLTQTEFDLPKSNVLQFNMQNGSILIIRPSGTEPQIKFYYTTCKTPKENEIILAKMQATIDELF